MPSSPDQLLSDSMRASLMRAVESHYGGDLFKADILFRQLRAHAGTDPVVAFAASQFLLVRGEQSNAWPLAEQRLLMPYYTRRPFHRMPIPLWRGEPLAGKRLLIFFDQGLGDAFLYARFIQEVQCQSEDLVLQVHNGSETFWAKRFPNAVVLGLNDLPPACDCRVNLGSLPSIFATDTLFEFSGAYLEEDPVGLDQVRSKLKGDLRIGLIWRGNPNHARDFERSIPLRAFRSLLKDQKLAKQGVRFFGLQVDAPGAKQAPDEWPSTLTDLGPSIASSTSPLDFAAGLVKELDLLITIDSAIANLAAAMDVPFWLVTYKVPDWRWAVYPSLDLTSQERSKWYGKIELFQSAERAEWERPLGAIQAALHQRLV